MKNKENKFQYVSNAGIVFEASNKKIGIDCLCKDSLKIYQDTPLEIREKLDLDVLIFTHEHEDHFCADYVYKLWNKNPKLRIYGGENTIQLLRKMHIPSQNMDVVQDGDLLDIGSFKIQFMQSVHEGEQYGNVINLTLLIIIEDKRLVITGDAMPCKALFERIQAWSAQIDWLFVPFPYVGLSSTRKLMQEYLDIKNIFVLHQPRKEADSQNWIANTKRLCDNAKDGLLYPIFPEELGKWYKVAP